MRPLPHPDRDSAPWWEALGRHELLLQRCDACGVCRWPPRAICNRCWSLEWAWIAASGRATVASWIVNRHRFVPSLESPYTVVLGRLEEQDDILIPGAWGGRPDGSDLAVGMAVRAGFADIDAEPDSAGPAPSRDVGALALIEWLAAPADR